MHLAQVNARLASHVCSHPYLGPWPPPKLPTCVASTDVIGDLHSAWQSILALDYRPIFESACRVLHAPAHDPRWADSVYRVTAAAERASRHAATARHDLLGRVFHWLLDTARYDGSYYTSTVGAALLAALAIRPRDLPEDLSQWRLVDPACGTGTLLMAAAQRIHDLRDSTTTETDAVTLLEHVITGLDINTSACHMAATTLGMLSPSTKFHKMNIERMPFGLQNPTAAKPTQLDPRVGSLELLDEGVDASGQARLLPHWSSGEHIDTGKLVAIPPNSFHLVIMNPPFTRDSLRYDHLGGRAERAMKAREGNLRSGRAGRGTSGSTAFLDLAEHLAHLDDGTVATVLPLSAASNPDGLEARLLLAEWFHIEWVISSHDPDRLYFSENTDISEILVIARRHTAEPSCRPPTKFVRLRHNPRTASEAIPLASALTTGTTHAHAQIEERASAQVAKGSWAPLGITSPHLAAVAADISAGLLFDVRLLGEVADVGPAGRRIRDAFSKSDVADTSGRRALWHNKTSDTQSLQGRTDVYIHAKSDKEALADRYWALRSNLLLCTEVRLTTARVVAVRLPRPAVGSRWVPISLRADDPRDPDQWAKAMTVWWNSTPGIITIVATAITKILERPELRTHTMRHLPVPNVTSEQVAVLAAIFDARPLDPLRRLSQADTDPMRAALDVAISKALDWPAEEIARARSELACEPSTGSTRILDAEVQLPLIGTHE